MKKSNALDIVKAIACVLIVGSHCLPIFQNPSMNFYYGQWFFRSCVPLFFISTGYFFEQMVDEKKRLYIKRILILYVIVSAIYLPAYVFKVGMKQIVSNLLFGYYHLWYLSALVIGLLLIQIFNRTLKQRKYWLVVSLVGGVLLGTYYKLFDNTLLEKLAKAVSLIGGSRHALLFAVPMLLIGEGIAHYKVDNKAKGKQRQLILLWLLLMIAGCWEATFLRSQLGDAVRLDVTILGWAPAIPLFLIGIVTEINIRPADSRSLRKITDIVYIVHIWALFAIRWCTGIEFFLGFVSVVVASFLIAYGADRIWNGAMRRNE